MRSKDTKITFFIYLPYECCVEEYLEQMAEKDGYYNLLKELFLNLKK